MFVSSKLSLCYCNCPMWIHTTFRRFAMAGNLNTKPTRRTKLSACTNTAKHGDRTIVNLTLVVVVISLFILSFFSFSQFQKLTKLGFLLQMIQICLRIV